MNAAIRAVGARADDRRGGGILPRGGTILGTARGAAGPAAAA
jgi:hypothetical protein